MAQRKGEYCCEPRCNGGRCEPRKPIIGLEVRHNNGSIGVEGQETRAMAQLALQLLEEQRRIIRSSHIMRRSLGRYERDSARRHRQEFHNSFDEVIQNCLDREVRDHRTSKLAQRARKSLLFNHASRLGGQPAVSLTITHTRDRLIVHRENPNQTRNEPGSNFLVPTGAPSGLTMLTNGN